MPTTPFRKNHLNEIRFRARQGIARRLYADADESATLLREFGDKVAQACGCKAVHGPIKSFERAVQKVDGRLRGEWYDLRDAVRMTLVAPNATALRRAQTEIRQRCQPQHRMGIVRDVELTADNSPCGYSGANIAVRLSNGRPGEIQMNIPEVMYGQLSKDVFCAALGGTEYHRIEKLKGVDGGLGHLFYEIYRVSPASPEGKAAATLSRRYFDCLRGNIGPMGQQQLAADLANFVASSNIHS